MRLRIPELMEGRKMKRPADLARALEARGVSRSTAYRLAKGEAVSPSLALLEALCDVFGIDDPGPLFDRE